MYAKCPKCGHAPLPENQASPAACPGCGVILAKIAASASAARAAASAVAAGVEIPSEPKEEKERPEWLEYAAGWLTYVPNEVSSINWYARSATLAVVALWTVWLFKSTSVVEGEYGSNFLHGIVLIFHEAGHVIFMLFGRFITILGGSLNQVLVPMILAGALLIQRRDPFGAAIFFWLAGFSVVDVALYMYDAFDPHMPLLGGGTGADRDSHDWQNLFGDMGLLRHARGIGMAFAMLGRAMMLAALAWGGYLLWKQKARLSDSVMAEGDF
ncbi:MAG: uncharacterized protein JWN73_2737 [Betaproteobacteria bacterium]|nr:uncharacterized protein [Betaproteobacteria bacterium]